MLLSTYSKGIFLLIFRNFVISSWELALLTEFIALEFYFVFEIRQTIFRYECKKITRTRNMYQHIAPKRATNKENEILIFFFLSFHFTIFKLIQKLKNNFADDVFAFLLL